MSEIITKPTEKKFYNQYLYKVSLRCRGARIFKILDPEKIRNINGYEIKVSYFPWNNLRHYEKQLIVDIAEVLRDFPEQYGTRVEGTILDIYTNVPTLYDALSKAFPINIIHRFEPDLASLDILDEKNTLAVKKLPHGKYSYKVFLKPHCLSNIDEKVRLMDYMESLKPAITLTHAVRSWFIHTYTNWDRRYILVDNEQTLMLLKLRQGSVFGQCYKYVVVDK